MSDNALSRTESAVNTDEKFRRFIYGNLFATGMHVWWLIGTLGILTIVSISFAFFAATVDAGLLKDPTCLYPNLARNAELGRLKTEQKVYDQLLSHDNLRKLAILELSKRELSFT